MIRYDYDAAVREFHTAFGHPTSAKPRMLEPKLVELRVRLIAEELCEYAAANGVALSMAVSPHAHDCTKAAVHIVVQHVPDMHTSMAEAADALGDINYVVAGANMCHGFPGTAVFEEIHRSNMSKLGADGKPIYREDGKILKGPNYAPPDVARVLASWAEFVTNIG
jgi:predicted HAD superfamily Cof-like phosphohydrolase